MLPVQGKITSRFGKRKHPVTGLESFHNGVDISCACGTPVLAPDYGIIMKLWSHPLGGLCMAMKSTEGIRFGFAHLSKRLVKEGQPVVQGQRIALTGNTGRSTGPHLHFTVQELGIWIDPLKYFDFKS